VRLSRAAPAEQARPRPAAVLDTQLERIDGANMERRAQHLKRDVVQSMSMPARVSLNGPDARTFVRRLVEQNESGSLSAQQQAQFLSRLQQANTRSDPSSLSASSRLDDIDLPEGAKTQFRTVDADMPNRDVDWAELRRVAEQHQSSWDSPEPPQVEPVDVERDPPSAGQRTPTRKLPSGNDAENR
jgi:hypothetical protein